MAPPLPTTAIQCTILAGQSLSAPVDCSNGSPVLIVMPPDWDPAETSLISLQMSVDGGVTFYDLFHPDGTEYTMTVKPGAAVLLASQGIDWATHIAIRSGSTAAPIPRTADRTFTIVMTT